MSNGWKEQPIAIQIFSVLCTEYYFFCLKSTELECRYHGGGGLKVALLSEQQEVEDEVIQVRYLSIFRYSIARKVTPYTKCCALCHMRLCSRPNPHSNIERVS